MADSTPPLLPQITVYPATTHDFYPIAALEAHVFYTEEFSAVAFGPTRDSHSNLKLREKTLASQPKEKGANNVVTKAVFIGEDGKEILVGAAGWSFHLGREENGEGKGGDRKVEGEGEVEDGCELVRN